MKDDRRNGVEPPCHELTANVLSLLNEEKLADKSEAGDEEKIESEVQGTLDGLGKNQLAEKGEIPPPLHE